MRVLALEPYYGGSHRAFLDGWIGRSRHDFDLHTLSPRKWKWRMRHSAVTLAGAVRRAAERGERWDVLFCSDMLNLAEFRGLAPEPARALPAVAYFHENQATYPVDHPSEFDYHFAFTNFTTALAADRVWWNSAYHRDCALSGLEAFLRRMPDNRPTGAVATIREKSEVRHPGIDGFPVRGERPPGPLRILWAARWEYDKGPDTFFAAMDLLADRGVDFELSVIGGGRARAASEVFAESRERHRDRIRHWGWVESREDYREVLLGADVVVSTARHEFFGIAVLEAVAAGAHPLVPSGLAYPEILGRTHDGCFHDGTAECVSGMLVELDGHLGPGGLPPRRRPDVSRFSWTTLTPSHDDAMGRMSVLGDTGGLARD